MDQNRIQKLLFSRGLQRSPASQSLKQIPPQVDIQNMIAENASFLQRVKTKHQFTFDITKTIKNQPTPQLIIDVESPKKIPQHLNNEQLPQTRQFLEGKIFNTPSRPLQPRITNFLNNSKQKQAPTVPAPPQPQVIDLSKVDQKQKEKYFAELAGRQQIQEDKRKREINFQQEALRKMNDKREIEKQKQVVRELINEAQGSRSNNQYVLKKKTDQTDEPTRQMSTYNQLLNEQKNTVQKIPVVEFNLLLKYLFLRKYHITEQEEDRKVIPNKFSNSEEYQRIFEYLFLNEAYEQLKQELITFINGPKYKFRKLQVKYDDTQHQKDGTILKVRQPLENTQNVKLRPKHKRLNQSVEDGEFDAHNDNNSSGEEPQVADGNCDLMVLKNHVVILSQGMNLNTKNMNNMNLKGSFCFGFLLDPQKAQAIAALKILTFAEPKYFQDWTDIILMPFSKITTSIREFLTIKFLQNEEISTIIYNPSAMRKYISDAENKFVNTNIIPDPRILHKFFESIQPHYNASQFQCIQEISLIDKGVCLLQGPPGTGKTHTLIGLVSAVYVYMMKLGVLGPKKILICAPSNAAIDEILTRIIRQGLKGESGNQIQPKVIRIGTINASEAHDQNELSSYCLEELAQKNLIEEEKFRVQTDNRTTGDVRAELTKVNHQFSKLEKLKKNNQSVNQLEYEELQKKRYQLFTYLDRAKTLKRDRRETYKRHLDRLLESAEIICTTLASSGSEKLDRYKGMIDVLIIDEAAQCVEPTNIIPLRLGIKKMILIGDPKQLPATTFAQSSQKTLYNRSLFERIIANGIDYVQLIDFSPYFLSIQYRMQPCIRQFPSQYFYGGKLTDHESTQGRRKYDQMALLDVGYGQEDRYENSYINKHENLIVQQILVYLRETHPLLSVGVVCGYKAQVKFIKKTFKEEQPKLFNKDYLSINTIDSFQGQEKDVIIFSCVRSNETRSVGFMNDQRRINVALTRARNSLFVIGDCCTVMFISLCKLSSDPCWKEYIKDMINRGGYYNISERGSEQIVERVVTQKDDGFDKICPENLQQLLALESRSKRKTKTYNIEDFKKTSVQIDEDRQRLELQEEYEKQEQEKQEKEERKKAKINRAVKSAKNNPPPPPTVKPVVQQITKNVSENNEPPPVFKNLDEVLSFIIS